MATPAGPNLRCGQTVSCSTKTMAAVRSQGTTPSKQEQAVPNAKRTGPIDNSKLAVTLFEYIGLFGGMNDHQNSSEEINRRTV